MTAPFTLTEAVARLYAAANTGALTRFHDDLADGDPYNPGDDDCRVFIDTIENVGVDVATGATDNPDADPVTYVALGKAPAGTFARLTAIARVADVSGFGVTYRVRCEDGAYRHPGRFGTIHEARTFAEWGHVCTRTHTIEGEQAAPLAAR